MIQTVKGQFQFIRNSIRTNNLTQILLWMHNLIGFYSFYRLGVRLAANPDGRKVLERRPRVTKALIESLHLENFPEQSFGKEFIKFILSNGLDKQPEFPPVSPLESERTAYAKVRWRETHDYRHVLTGFTASLADEAIIAAFQFGNLPNSWSFLVMVIAPVIAWKDLNPFKQWYRMGEAYRAGRRAVCLGSVDYESEFTTPVNDLRAKWRVRDLTHLSARFKN